MSKLCFCGPPQQLSVWGMGRVMPFNKKGSRINLQRRNIWLQIENSRLNWYKFAQIKITAQFNVEQRAIISSIKNSLLANNAIISADTILQDRSVLDGWARLMQDVYLSVGENFGNITLNNLKSGKSFAFKRDDSFDIWKTEVLKWLSKNSSTKIVNISDTTRELVRAQLSEGVDEGESIDTLAARIDKLYLEQIIPFRSEVIARTEVISASNLGSRAAALHTGLNLKHAWLATHDIRTRIDHIAADGQTQEMSDPYTVGGEQLMFPGDTSLGASAGNVIQCRCAETYEVSRG